MASLRAYTGNVRFWLKGYLLLGVVVMVVAMLVYSNHLVTRMRAEAEATSRLFSRYIANVLFEVADDGSLADLRSVVRDSNLPIIITVFDGRPILWSGVPVDDRTEEDFQMLVGMDVNDPPTEKLRRLVELYREFDKTNDPIPIRVLGMEGPQGYVHFGPSPLQRELRLMPFALLGIFLVFMGVAVQGLRYLKLSEQRSLWVGLAKETAHQLGTPISSLMGWTQLIKDRATEKGYDDISSSVGEMEVDIERLRKVTDRFSKIGSQPALTRVPLTPILERTVDYFDRRLPRLHTKSSITLLPGRAVEIQANQELIEWVFENLVKNGLDALGEDGGNIEIRTDVPAGDHHVIVYVRDDGRGIPSHARDRVFRPGFTTKRRGWGLGLALARRIVEDYHGGAIRLVESRAGKGTTFSVKLPLA